MKIAISALFLAAIVAFAGNAEDTGIPSDRAAAILSEARAKRSAATDKIEREYRVTLASTFAFADRVEVFLLDHDMGLHPDFPLKEGDETFFIRPFRLKAKIIEKRTVPPAQVKKWCDAIGKAITAEKVSGNEKRHSPIQAARIYAGDQLLFETSFSWSYNNFTVDNRLEFLAEDDKQFEDLKILFRELVPIPRGSRGAREVRPEEEL
jgi:hypothetical protein